MFFEFQLSAATLGAQVRNQLRNLKLCVPDLSFQKEKLLVNRIVVLETTSLQRRSSKFPVATATGPATIDGKKCVLVQPLQLELVTEEDVLTSGPAAAPIKLAPTIAAQLGITASVSGSDAFLQLALDGIDFGSFDAVIDSQTREVIVSAFQAKLSPIKRKVDTSALQPLIPGMPLNVTNAGVTTTSDGAALVLRVEINGAENQSSHWEEFYNTYNTNLLGNRNWALLVDKDLLIAGMNAKLGASLAASSEKFLVDSGPSVSWNQGAPGFTVAFSGEVIDACTCLWGEIDVDVDVSSGITLSVPSKNVLRTRIQTTYDASDLEIFCCALTGALFWPVVGLVYLDDEKVSFGEYLLGWLAGPALVFIAVCAVAGNQSIDGQVAGSGGQCTKVDDETIECDQNVSIGFGPLGGTYDLEAITGMSRGPVLSGTSAVHALKDPRLEVAIVNEFSWKVVGSCSKSFGSAVTGGLTYHNAVPGSVLKICEVKVLEDPAKAFQGVTFNDHSITIKVWLSPEYIAAPYPCRLRMTTNGGARIITFAPAKAEITPQQEQALKLEAQIAQTTCYASFKPVPPDDITKFRWVTDPRPEVEVHRVWQIVVSKMKLSEQVEIVGADGKAIATATASARGVAHATVLQEQPIRQTELGLRFAAAYRGADTQEVKRYVSIKQVEMTLAARFQVGAQFESLELERHGEQTLLRLRSSAAETVYEVTAPEAPALIEKRLLDAVPAGATVSSSPRARQVALSTDIVHVVRQRDRERFILSTDRTYLTVHGHGGDPERIQLRPFSDSPVVRIAEAAVPGRADTVALVLGSGDVLVIDVSDPKRPQEVTRYHGTPWFIDSARSGSLLARRSDDGLSAFLYRMGNAVEPWGASLHPEAQTAMAETV